ncbi:Uncharacterised protein [BD1-7 clade bacterium]|uniref:DUF1653 domain-containing protein n=1 Tax=BD1-7 clade bacterium TaxID=2029982 RepID=A0A5S9N0N6_9GAMM|nr:Uncharacterised protein [BD1-7 clade bacterium]CAA0083388.1 Uncharacterised protein [BD1-7 clade bacterium]
MKDNLKLGRYRHYKGNDYEVIGVARHSETEEPHVVYRTLYGNFDLWIRPLTMFTETIERDGQTIQRFTYIGEKD